MSSDSADASEFSADDSEHIAAEKIPATRYADTNGGRLFTMNVGRIASGPSDDTGKEGIGFGKILRKVNEPDRVPKRIAPSKNLLESSPSSSECIEQHP
jgi:hypothetical protein